MKVEIYSRKAIEAMIEGQFPQNTAVISFYSPKASRRGDYAPVDYRGRPARAFFMCAHDIDIDALDDFGLTYETYMPDVKELAAFIEKAAADGMDIICQCDYGQSRSAACAAAISEHFFGTGIRIFADYRYYPNQLVFNKIYEALEGYDRERRGVE